MIRHWNAWDEGKRSHLFVADARTGEAKDLTPKLDVNTPPAPFGGSNDYAWSPDGKELAFTAEPIKDMAWSTNTDIWTVPAEGGEPKNLTEENQGADAQPAYSPHGNRLAYLSQARPGFEADMWVLRVLDLRPDKDDKKSSPPYEEFHGDFLDRPIQSFCWIEHRVPPGWLHEAKLAAVVDDHGEEQIVELKYNSNGFDGHVFQEVRVKGGINTAVQASRAANRLVFLRGDVSRPGEVYATDLNGAGLTQLTHHNDPLLAGLDLPKLERFTFKGADGDDVFGWLSGRPGSTRTRNTRSFS